MFKLFAFACVLAVTYAAPQPGLVYTSPVVHTPVVAHAVQAHPVAVSHSSSHVVHNAPIAKVVAHPVVHTVPAVHAVHAVHTVPIIKAAPIYAHAPVVTHHVHAAPVLVHH